MSSEIVPFHQVTTPPAFSVPVGFFCHFLRLPLQFVVCSRRGWRSTMPVVESEVLVKSIPTLLQGGMKLMDFGKTRRELTSAREELVEKGKRITEVEQQLNVSTMRVVAVTEELTQ